jgi:hypothetical protein
LPQVSFHHNFLQAHAGNSNSNLFGAREGGGKQTRRVIGTAKTNRDGPQARHCDLGVTQKEDWRTNAKLKSEIPDDT